MAEFDLETFIKHLIEAAVWCQHHLKEDDDASILWSLWDREIDLADLTPEQMNQLFGQVTTRRSQQTHQLPMPTEYEDLLLLIQEGGLMIFYYTGTTCDGAPPIESKGFFDVSNCPPYATWVYPVGADSLNIIEYLIAWVPPQFLRDVDNGIGVCSDMSINWLTEMRGLEYEKLLKAAYLWI